MADLEELETALDKAQEAGDRDAVRTLSEAILRKRRGIPDDFEQVGRYRDGTVYRQPDGQLAFVSRGFSTTDQDQIDKMFNQGLHPYTPEVGVLEGTLRSGLQGATFYTGDEIVAGAAAALEPLIRGENGTDFSQRYNTYLSLDRARNDRFKQTHPKTALGAEITGGVLGAGTAAGAGLTTLKAGTQGTRALFTRGAIDGGLYGGAAGFGSADGGAIERLQGLGKGAFAGSTIGGTAAPAIAGATVLGRSLLNKIRRNMGAPEAQAVARLQHAAGDAGLAAEDISRNLDKLGPEGMLVDAIGDQGRSLARSSAGQSPKAREILERPLAERMANQPDRLADSLQRAADLDRFYTVPEVREAARAGTKSRLNTAYEDARSNGFDIDPSTLDDLAVSSLARDAFEEGERLATDRLVAEAAQRGKTGADVLNNRPSRFDILDEARRSLEAQAAVPPGRAPTNAQSIAGMMSRSIRDRIEDAMPEHANARGLTRRLYRQEDAIDLGAEGARRRVPADFRQRIDAVEPSLRADAARGYAAGKLEQIENSRGAPGLVDDLFGSSRQQDALEAALGRKASEVQRQLDAERAFEQTHRALAGPHASVRQNPDAGAFAKAAVDLAASGLNAGALTGGLAKRMIPGAVRNMSTRNDAAVAPVLAELLKGRRVPPVAQRKKPGLSAMQRLLMRSLSQQGGVGVAGMDLRPWSRRERLNGQIDI